MVSAPNSSAIRALRCSSSTQTLPVEVPRLTLTFVRRSLPIPTAEGSRCMIATLPLAIGPHRVASPRNSVAATAFMAPVIAPSRAASTVVGPLMTGSTNDQ